MAVCHAQIGAPWNIKTADTDRGVRISAVVDSSFDLYKINVVFAEFHRKAEPPCFVSVSQLFRVIGNKSAIYISHRLSSCRFCDEVAVFCEGSIVQKGTHDALAAQTGGKYHELWHAQAQYYDEKQKRAE